MIKHLRNIVAIPFFVVGSILIFVCFIIEGDFNRKIDLFTIFIRESK